MLWSYLQYTAPSLAAFALYSSFSPFSIRKIAFALFAPAFIDNGAPPPKRGLISI